MGAVAEDRDKVTANISYSPVNQVTGVPVTFVNKSSFVEELAEIKWEFDDNSEPEFGEEVTHSFSEAGVYNVKLSIKDLVGTKDKISVPIRIYERFGILVQENSGARVQVIAEEYKAGPVKTGRKAKKPFDPNKGEYEELATRLASEIIKKDDSHNGLVEAIQDQLQLKVHTE